MNSREIERIAADWVASPPTVYFRFKEAIDDPDSSWKDFGEILRGDPALTARLLKIVNSAFYGLSTRVETVEHALTIVGLDQLSELILATTVMNEFKGIPREIITMSSFWEHNMACGLAAQIVASFMEERNLERFYVAGMLHDIGSLPIYKKAPEKAMRAIDLSLEKNISLFEAERQIFGFNHADVGASLLKAWQLPSRLTEVVATHHDPASAKNHPLEAAVVHLADRVAHEMGLGKSGEPSVPSLQEGVWKRIDLPELILEDVRIKLEEQFKTHIEIFL